MPYKYAPPRVKLTIMEIEQEHRTNLATHVAAWCLYADLYVDPDRSDYILHEISDLVKKRCPSFIAVCPNWIKYTSTRL